MLLTPGNEWELSLHSDTQGNPQTRWPHALNLLQALHTDQSVCLHPGITGYGTGNARTEKRQDAYYWRLLATAFSFALFGLSGLCLRLFVFPVLSCLPGSVASHQRRARRTISRLFWLFIRIMARMGVLTYEVQGAEKLGRPGQMIIANHPSLIDVVFLIGLVRDANCVVKRSLWENPFTRGPVRSTGYISNDGSMDMLDAAVERLQSGQTLIIFPEGTRTQPGQPPVFHRARPPLHCVARA